MAWREIDLLPGEQVILSSNPHWWFFWKEVVGGLGVLVIGALWIWTGGALATIFGWLLVVAVVAWVARSAVQFAQWRTTRFLITDRRVAFESGMVRREGVSIPLARVNNVNFRQGIIARLLDNGIVTIESAAEGDSVFENIPHPDTVRRVIFERMNDAESSDSRRNAAAIAEALQGQSETPGVHASVTERLHELDELKAQGLISDDEYDRKRAAIIDDI